jgi:uncharacterized protein Yka (UPF0111/DUF47 family)
VSTAIVIDSYEIQSIWQRKASVSSSFDEIAVKLRRIAKTVKQEWNNFSEEDREALKELAYSIIEPKKSIFTPWRKIRARVYMMFLAATNQLEAFELCIKALDMLVENILDAVERQDSGFQALLSDTLEQLYSDEEQGKALKPEETREWLRNLSDIALGEV